MRVSAQSSFDCTCRGGTQCFIWEAPPSGLTPNPHLYTIFDRKGAPFVHLLLANGTPFTYLQPWSKHLGTLEEIRHKDALC